MKKTFINAMIVDDHILIRKGLKSILEMNTPIKITAQSADGYEALETLKELNGKIDLIIVDHEMPEMRGDKLIKEIRKIYKQNVYIIAFSHYDDELTRNNMLNAGANGFVSKADEYSKIYNTFLAPFNLEYND